MNNRYHRNRTLVAALVLTLVITACGINLPFTQIKTGPTQTIDIQVPMPEDPSTSVDLNLEFVAGDLKLTPGDSESLISGKATFNASDLAPEVETTGTSYSLSSGDMEIDKMPVIKDEVKNEWDLQIANTPISLNIKAGAYNGNFELGGLSIEKLAVSEGGSDVSISFSSLNLVDMSSFTYTTGGSSLEMKGLANANFEQMTFNSGAGEYTLSFDGDLQRAASVNIESGVSTITIIIPEGVSARVSFDGGLSTVDMDGGWTQDGLIYTHSGNGPTITITVKMGVGTLNLRTE